MIVKRVTTTTSSCGEKTKEYSKRLVIRNFLNEDEINIILKCAKNGISSLSDNYTEEGPTIFDPDSLLVLGPGAKLERVKENIFDSETLKLYGELMKRIQNEVKRVHELDILYHTAPTFIAQLKPSNKTKHIHDEYWHVHVDKKNTEHYDYSALVYLSTYQEDFEGGIFQFHQNEYYDDENDDVFTIKPEKGMFITFASGSENPHRVTPVTKGTRIAWSTWWTCDQSKEMTNSRLKQLIHDDL